MSINIYTVTNHLSENGWKLISDSYKNLNTELEMVCPKGHHQIISYGQWRKNPICSVCFAGNSKKLSNQIPEKSDNTRRILALDAATVITGFAIFDDNELVYYGTHEVNRSDSTEKRINEMKIWLKEGIENWKPDFIGVDFLPINYFSVYQRGY